MRFHIYRGEASRAYFFELRTEADAVLLTSQPYADQAGCLDGVRDAAERLAEVRYLTVTEGPGGHYVRFNTPDGLEMAHSRAYTTELEAATALASLLSASMEQEAYEVNIATTSEATGETTRVFTSPFDRAAFKSVEERYDFSWRSRSGQPGFEAFQREDDQQYYSHFNGADGKAILFSRGFTTASKRNRRIRTVIRAAVKAHRYIREEHEGQYFFILTARNKQEIGRSRLFNTAEAMEAAIAYLQTHAADYAAAYIKPRKRRARGDRYDLEQVSRTGQMGFEVFRSEKNRKYYFHFNDEHGAALLYSQGYAARKSRDNGLRSVIRHGRQEGLYEQKEDDGRFYFILRAGNRQQIARSRYFDSPEALADAQSFCITTIPGFATAYGVTLDTTTTTTTEILTITVDRDQPTVEKKEYDVSTLYQADMRRGEVEDTTVYQVEVEEAADTAHQVEIQKLVWTSVSDFVEQIGDATYFTSHTGTTDTHKTSSSETSASSESTTIEHRTSETGSTVYGGSTSYAKTPAPPSKPVLPPEPEAPVESSKRQMLRETIASEARIESERAEAQLRAWIQAEKEYRAEKQSERYSPFPLSYVYNYASQAGQTRREHERSTSHYYSAPSGYNVQQPTLYATAPSSVYYQSYGSGAPPPVSGSTEVSRSSSGRVWMWVFSLLALAAVVYLLRGFIGFGGTDAESEAMAQSGFVGQTISSEPPAASVLTPAPAVVGMGAADFGFRTGSVEGEMANFLSLSSNRPPVRFTMDQVRFSHNSGHINADAYPQIDNLVRLLNEYPGVQLTIYGYIDGTEREAYTGVFAEGGLGLSAIRARCIWDKLVKRGIDGDRLEFLGLADTRPIASDRTPQGRQQNRRIELVVTQR